MNKEFRILSIKFKFKYISHLKINIINNREFEPMRKYITCSKDQVFQGKSQKKTDVGRSRLEKKDAMINTVINEDPKGKRPLGRTRLRWEDCVKREVKKVDPRANWREIAENRIRWREICFTEWS